MKSSTFELGLRVKTIKKRGEQSVQKKKKANTALRTLKHTTCSFRKHMTCSVTICQRCKTGDRKEENNSPHFEESISLQQTRLKHQYMHQEN